LSEEIKHECGLAMIRLLKPLDYYHKRYGSALWGLSRMCLLLEKQHNRGQDGAGMAAVKLDQAAGLPYIARERVVEPAPPWQTLFKRVWAPLEELKGKHPDILNQPEELKEHFPFAGELLMGHLRYGTYGTYDIEACHPVHRPNNWQTRNLILAGNFNLTNVEDMFQKLVELGQHPRFFSDTELALERVGHFLDTANEQLFQDFKAKGHTNREISDLIADNLDLVEVLQRSARLWDGGFVMGGLLGHGDMFAIRDANGIRPAFYYEDEEVVVVASERPAIATCFNVPIESIQELPPAHVLVVKRSGELQLSAFTEPKERTSCSFERIYFSRGSDPDIYQERLNLGRLLAPEVLSAIEYDLDNTVFSYIPNTAQVAFWGMLKGLEDYHNELKIKSLLEISNPDSETLRKILEQRVRVEYLVQKDTKLRTFITDDSQRDEMASHVYDVTYGTLKKGVDRLVCIDDSIVRGTTLKQSILRMLLRLGPREIVIVSSAPQIRYPDCYGIDMSQIGKFIAFQAAISLLKENGLEHVIRDTYESIQKLKAAGELERENCVKAIYAPFTDVQISNRIADLVRKPGQETPVKFVYQSIEGLKKAIPDHQGDWYFTGNFPTPGGNRVVNQAFANYYEGRQNRSY
jgi:amidophosphoribosyltransferase